MGAPVSHSTARVLTFGHVRARRRADRLRLVPYLGKGDILILGSRDGSNGRPLWPETGNVPFFSQAALTVPDYVPILGIAVASGSAGCGRPPPAGLGAPLRPRPPAAARCLDIVNRSNLAKRCQTADSPAGQIRPPRRWKISLSATFACRSPAGHGLHRSVLPSRQRNHKDTKTPRWRHRSGAHGPLATRGFAPLCLGGSRPAAPAPAPVSRGDFPLDKG